MSLMCNAVGHLLGLFNTLPPFYLLLITGKIKKKPYTIITIVQSNRLQYDKAICILQRKNSYYKPTNLIHPKVYYENTPSCIVIKAQCFWWGKYSPMFGLQHHSTTILYNVIIVYIKSSLQLIIVSLESAVLRTLLIYTTCPTIHTDHNVRTKFILSLHQTKI